MDVSRLSQPPMHTLGGVGWMRMFRYLDFLYRNIKDIEGAVVECGVGTGSTLVMLSYLAGAEGAGRTVYGFDSFEGFPEPSEEDRSWRNPQKGEWRFAEEEVRRALDIAGIFTAYPQLKIELRKGWFSETLPAFRDTIAFLHVDADLYHSTRDILRHLYPLVAQGGIIAFDDYRDIGRGEEKGEKWPGTTKAVDEYFAEEKIAAELNVYEERDATYRFRKFWMRKP